MPPVPTPQQQQQQNALNQLTQHLSQQQRQALGAYIQQNSQPGQNTAGLIQAWLSLNGGLQGLIAAQQQGQQQGRTGVQQGQAQVGGQGGGQGRPAGPAGGVAAQQMINHLFPAQLLGNVPASLQHLRKQLYQVNAQGNVAPTQLLNQAVQFAKSRLLTQQQLDLLRQVLPNSSSNSSAGASPAAGSPPGTPQRAVSQQPGATPVPQTLPEQAQLLGARIKQLTIVLARPDIDADNRQKLQASLGLAQASLGKVMLAMQASGVQMASQPSGGQGTPAGASAAMVGAGSGGQGSHQPPNVLRQQSGGIGQGMGHQGTPIRQPSNLGPQGQQPGAPFKGGINPSQLGQQSQQTGGGLAFGNGVTAQTMLGSGSSAPTTSAQAAAQTRPGTPAAAGMATTPSGGNLSVSGSTPQTMSIDPKAASTSAPTASAPPAPPSKPLSTDPRPDSSGRTVSKRKLRELLASIDDGDRLTDEAEELMQDIADDFLQSVTTGACQLAKHRKSERLEVRDIAFHLGEWRARSFHKVSSLTPWFFAFRRTDVQHEGARVLQRGGRGPAGRAGSAQGQQPPGVPGQAVGDPGRGGGSEEDAVIRGMGRHNA